MSVSPRMSAASVCRRSIASVRVNVRPTLFVHSKSASSAAAADVSPFVSAAVHAVSAAAASCAAVADAEATSAVPPAQAVPATHAAQRNRSRNNTSYILIVVVVFFLLADPVDVEPDVAGRGALIAVFVGDFKPDAHRRVQPERVAIARPVLDEVAGAVDLVERGLRFVGADARLYLELPLPPDDAAVRSAAVEPAIELEATFDHPALIVAQRRRCHRERCARARQRDF